MSNKSKNEHTPLLNKSSDNKSKVSAAAAADDEEEEDDANDPARPPPLRRMPTELKAKMEKENCSINSIVANTTSRFIASATSASSSSSSSSFDPSPPKPKPMFFTTNWRGDWIISGVRWLNVKHSGALEDVYYWSLRLQWAPFLLSCCFFYAFVSFLFALLFYPFRSFFSPAIDFFFDLFFFHIFFLTGFGMGAHANIENNFLSVLLSIESLVKIVLFAIITSIIYTRFSRPVHRIRFSKQLIIGKHGKQKKLLFRVTNQRKESMVNMRIDVTVTRTIKLEKGKYFRQFIDLPLVRHSSPHLLLPITVMHIIDKNSPLYFDRSNETLNRDGVSFFVVLSATDTVFGSTVWARHIYNVEDVYFDHEFVDMFGVDHNGQRYCEMLNMDRVRPIPPAENNNNDDDADDADDDNDDANEKKRNKEKDETKAKVKESATTPLDHSVPAVC